MDDVDTVGESRHHCREPPKAPPLIVVAGSRRIAIDAIAIERLGVVNQHDFDVAILMKVEGCGVSGSGVPHADVLEVSVSGYDHPYRMTGRGDAMGDPGDGFPQSAGASERRVFGSSNEYPHGRSSFSRRA